MSHHEVTLTTAVQHPASNSFTQGLNLDYCPMEETLVSAPGRDLILFVAYLVDSLPGFIPKTTVEFEGRLNEPIVKNLELTNPSPRPLIYSVRIEGSPVTNLNRMLSCILSPPCSSLKRKCVELTILWYFCMCGSLHHRNSRLRMYSK